MLELGNQDFEFNELISLLAVQYQPRPLCYGLLTQKLQWLESPIKISELAELARQIFFKEGIANFDLNQPRFSIESFCEDVTDAIIDMQYSLIDLFKENKNKKGYILLISSGAVFWDTRPSDMQKFIDNKTAKEPIL